MLFWDQGNQLHYDHEDSPVNRLASIDQMGLGSDIITVYILAQKMQERTRIYRDIAYDKRGISRCRVKGILKCR